MKKEEAKARLEAANAKYKDVFVKDIMQIADKAKTVDDRRILEFSSELDITLRDQIYNAVAEVIELITEG